MNNPKILLLNSYSSGMMYIDEILERGFGCILVNILSCNENIDPLITKRVKEINNRYSSKDFIAFALPDDFNTVMEYISDYDIAAVCCGSDTGVPLADQISQALKLPGNNPCSTYMRTTKSGMMTALQNAGCRHILTSVVSTPEQIEKFLALRYPLWVNISINHC